MSELSIFKLDNQTINVKDAQARTDAGAAKSLATTANGNATTALNKVTELEKLSRLEVSYEASSETLTITTGSHTVA